MTKNTPKTHVGVKGNMTAKGADRVGLVLAFTAMLAVVLSGAALIVWVAS
jgi:hypothetical protein